MSAKKRRGCGEMNEIAGKREDLTNDFSSTLLAAATFGVGCSMSSYTARSYPPRRTNARRNAGLSNTLRTSSPLSHQSLPVCSTIIPPLSPRATHGSPTTKTTANANIVFFMLPPVSA